MAAQASAISSIHVATAPSFGHPHAPADASYSYEEYSESSGVENLLSGTATAANTTTVPQSQKQIVFATLDDPEYSAIAFWVNVFILVLILVSTAVFCVSSLPQYVEDTPSSLVWLEIVCVGVFTIEYVTKLLTCDNVWQFVKGPMNIVDLAAILPFYIELALSGNNLGSFAVIRVVRLTRVFRLFKLSKYSKGFGLVTQALMASLDALGLLVFLFLLAVVFFSSGLYYAELSESTYDDAQQRWIRSDGKVSPFQSIPACFWWSVVTMTTVGYGDHVPLSTAGRLVASVTMISGVLLISFPITVIGSNFAKGKSAETLAYLDSEQKQVIKSLAEVHAVLEVLHTKQHNINLVVRALQARLHQAGHLT
ncbi:Kcna5-prov protein [Thecamonas trahens ATCC 50062]|uniref:Kcna5-prov protein n=1 Tax=Thecamonas trahens ATCC 50062 TaxID=461836 RepID=A0A0L0DU81_THETB|nr:Kcna5-prov protein [Thecamonas trahens ATCC 50062]KNC55591.1 Kcna5-prov protein [Thecamonas trahens ATCC 50062]|eukprot:XP_013761364.1 Kcna5-prov protein [Thecamonas trahens ATCC 50062]